MLDCDRSATATVVDAAGHRSRVSLLALDGPPPRPGDWLVVHSGYAIGRMADGEARRALAEWRAVARPPGDVA